MSKKSIKPVSFALGTALVTSLAAGNLSADTAADPFAMNELNGGYMQLADAGSADKSGQEGKCGGKKTGQEGKCGSKNEMKQNMEGKCGEKKSDKEGKCGEGKCGSKK